MNLSKRNLSIFGGVTIVLIFFVLLLVILPQWQSNAYHAKFTPQDIQALQPQGRMQLERNAADIENATRLTPAQIIGGLALLSGLWFTYQNVRAAQDNAKSSQENIKIAQENLRITEEGKLTDRFSKAVELLGSEELEIRLGGIYALERIARDSQKDHWTVIEVLTAFVRENSHKKSEGQKDEITHEDIQAIMTVIGRRKWIETEKQPLNLKEVNLTGCDLKEAFLRDAELYKANLRGANLTGAILEYANLSKAKLSKAKLSKANLKYANLSETNLREADFNIAILTGANLNGADLRKADLKGADFRAVKVKKAKFNEANFDEVELNKIFLELHQLPTSEELITLKQILSAKNSEEAKLQPKLKEELKKMESEAS